MVGGKAGLGPAWILFGLEIDRSRLEVKWKDLLVKRIWELGLLLYILKNSKLA